MQVMVVDVPARHRYEARTGDQLAGYVTYQRQGDVVTFVHTEVLSEYENHGVGGALVRGALDDSRARGLTVVPACPFMRGWIERHPDYADLVSAQGPR